MNDWKDLEINNLPPDILTGEYEVECMVCNEEDWSRSITWYDGSRIKVLRNLQEGKIIYRYRRKINVPTHQQIIKFWWFVEYCGEDQWVKVIGYLCKSKKYIIIQDVNTFTYHSKDWFVGRKFAKFPPE